ncbi:hypothetical protein CLOM_g5286 [Closterium sp. NIES-68]|nr:hypothetical protein CLOM_g5286 [Closterium sp. NIES-68]GJP68010.1 hypothetical protein CLOP_g24766 [Closterium sp. NIES-67]
MGAEFSKHVDRLLNEAETYQLAVQSTFSEYAKLPPGCVAVIGGGGGGGGGGEPAVAVTRAATKEGPASAAKRTAPAAEDDVGSVTPSPASPAQSAAGSPGVEQRYLLEAAQAVIKKVSAKMDSRASRLCLRPPTKRDCEYVLFLFPSLAACSSLSLPQFETFVRAVVKRVAVDKGRRLLLFVAGGVMVVHTIKGTIRKLPLVGAPVAMVVSAVFPTSVVGPAVGVAGALMVEERKRLR